MPERCIINTSLNIYMIIKRIIVEGPDCSGKSTVVERIKNALRRDSKSLHHKDCHQYARYLREYSNAEEIVFDRSHISEIVYSILWRDGNPFSKGEEKILDLILQHESLIIFACPSLELMRSRFNSRKFPQQIKFEELVKSRELFISKLGEISFIPYLSNNFLELDELLEKIRSLVK